MTTCNELDPEMVYECCESNKMYIMDYIFLAVTCRCLYLIDYDTLLMVSMKFTKIGL